MDILLKSIFSGALVGAILVLTKGKREDVAGLLVLFPIITFLSYYFIGSTESQEVLTKTVRASLWAAPTWILTIVSVYLLLPHVDYRISLGIGMLVWFLSASIYLLVRA